MEGPVPAAAGPVVPAVRPVLTAGLGPRPVPARHRLQRRRAHHPGHPLPLQTALAGHDRVRLPARHRSLQTWSVAR